MFRFRLQRVLELRERKERDAATALVQARDDAERARAEQARLEAVRAELATGDAAGSGDGASSVGALRTLHFLLDRLDERVADAANDATTAEHVVSERQDALTSAFRDRRTLDRLRERHSETWRAAEAAADLRQMDEIALTRYAKPTSSSTPSSDEK